MFTNILDNVNKYIIYRPKILVLSYGEQFRLHKCMKEISKTRIMMTMPIKNHITIFEEVAWNHQNDTNMLARLFELSLREEAF